MIVWKVLRNWDIFFSYMCCSDFMGILWKINNRVFWIYLILIMFLCYFKVENIMDFEIEMEFYFYFKSYCDFCENIWFFLGVVLFDCFCYERLKKVGVYVFNNF